jgi:hypothetical protein
LRRLTINRLHGVISQKIRLFITTAVGTSNPSATDHERELSEDKVMVNEFKHYAVKTYGGVDV